MEPHEDPLEREQLLRTTRLLAQFPPFRTKQITHLHEIVVCERIRGAIYALCCVVLLIVLASTLRNL